MEHDDDCPGVDRRNLIKRAGIVTAGVAVWSTPGITTLASGAHAAVGSPAPSCDCAGASCGNYKQCGSGCFCFPTPAGGCACSRDSSCSGLLVCSGQDDCGPGFNCILTCCRSEAVCVPNCDPTPLRRAPLEDGVRTTSGM